ncbi:hypothetical protein HPC49_27885 [Pyxidicoccus fallax]|uniref:Uncharacterized protein n=1 Tax=Pyxidicoccus fallax TaxID=394095 RepID=A0A848LT36_9BACT|nr:hypothetical protein [Pyxidicoccus fallax]NMO20851.1 hypothetical protein [Pyxidicoccus fallax]NPC82026.1 hypothetical protein [Pyxidicoccus fallax]
MLVPAVALGCALLLAQTEGEEARVADVLPVLRVEPAEPPVIQPPASPLPRQDWYAPKVCLRLPPTKEVPSGQWRAQCDAKARRCLVAPRYERDAEGQETERPLERVRACTEEFHTPDAALLKTYRLEPAVAEAPPGWYRDERGRVMQFNFDLNRRLWLGGAWAPLWREGDAAGRMRADFGIAVEIPGEGRRLHRLRFIETELYLGDLAGFDSTLMRYDFSVERKEPLFRVTTFFGKPRRYDIDINLGLWMEVLHAEELERGATEAGFLTWGAVHATLDLWHSKDLVSYVRVRAGPSVERDYKNGFTTLVPGAVLEGDLTLDRDGFHHLRLGVEAEKVLLAQRVEGRPLRPERLRVSAGYEFILLAINDQPLSLVVDGRGAWREDLANVPARWEWSAAAGLRYSLWAPARRSAPKAPDVGE